MSKAVLTVLMTINCRQIKVTSVILIRSRFVNIHTENSLVFKSLVRSGYWVPNMVTETITG